MQRLVGEVGGAQTTRQPCDEAVIVLDQLVAQLRLVGVSHVRGPPNYCLARLETRSFLRGERLALRLRKRTIADQLKDTVLIVAALILHPPLLLVARRIRRTAIAAAIADALRR